MAVWCKPEESNSPSVPLAYVTHRLDSPLLGEITYAAEDTVTFPGGLPGFPTDDCFLIIERGDWRPLLLLQSTVDHGVCLPVIPVKQVIPQYRVRLDAEHKVLLGLGPDHDVGGADLLVLATVRFDEGGEPIANLMAPLVVRVSERRGVQVVQTGDEYPLQARLLTSAAESRPGC